MLGPERGTVHRPIDQGKHDSRTMLGRKQLSPIHFPEFVGKLKPPTQHFGPSKFTQDALLEKSVGPLHQRFS